VFHPKLPLLSDRVGVPIQVYCNAMSYHRPKDNRLKLISTFAVMLMHLGLIYALIQGLNHKEWVQTLPPIMANIITPSVQTPVVPESVPTPKQPPPKPEQVVEVSKPTPKPKPKSKLKPVVKPKPIETAKPLQTPKQRPAPLQPATTHAVPFAPTKPAPVRKAAVVKADACRTPNYPKSSLRRNEEGLVKLRFLVDVDGKVLQSEVVSSSGYPMLDEAAREALALCVFQPATLDGKAVQDWALLQYEWKIGSRR